MLRPILPAAPTFATAVDAPTAAAALAGRTVVLTGKRHLIHPSAARPHRLERVAGVRLDLR